VDKLVAEGRVLPAEKDKLVNFMASIDAEHVFEFSEGQDTQPGISCLAYWPHSPSASISANTPRTNRVTRSPVTPKR
jgi:hypothetical protein